MIEIVEGRGVGAGKTYYVCTRIIQTLASGGTVWASSTFGLNWPETKALVESRFGKILEDDQYRVFENSEVGRLHEITPAGTDDNPVLIVIDEAHMELNARDWADKNKRPFFNWLTQSRHDNNDLIFISQHAANIDKQIARLVTFIIRMRNTNNWMVPGIGRWPFKRFVAVRLDQDGKTVMERKWLRQDAGIFKCYRSKVMNGAHKRLGVVIPRKQLKSRAHSSQMGKIFILVAILGLAFGGYKIYALTRKEEPKPVVQRGVPDPVVTRQASATVTRPGPVVPAAAYDIEEEEFRGTDERTFLRTVKGTYQLGAMSVRGHVMEIGTRKAKILTPAGRMLYVLARDEGLKPLPGETAESAETSVESQMKALKDLTDVQRGMGGYGRAEENVPK